MNQIKPEQTEETKIEDKGTDSPPPRKKTRSEARKSKDDKKVVTKPRGKRGKLAGLMIMPIDIFEEVVSHLLPVDLLHLSRTNKFIRSILMSKSARHMWLTSFAVVDGHPPCPASLSEPAFASLLHDNMCHYENCVRRIMKPDFERLHRLCSIHAPEYGRLQEISLHSVIDQLRPWTTVVHSMDFVPIPAQVFKTHLNSSRPVPSTARQAFEEVRDYLQKSFPKPDALVNVAQKLALKDYFIQKTETLKQHAKEKSDIAAWYDKQKQNKTEERHDRSKQRAQSILEKLRAQGWEEADLKDNCLQLHSKEYHSILSQSTLLSETIWKRINPRLMTILDERKAARVLREQESRRDTRATEILGLLRTCIAFVPLPYEDFRSWDDVMPSTKAHLLKIPSLAALIENDEVPVTLALLTSKNCAIATDFCAYRMRVRRHLVQLLRDMESGKPLAEFGNNTRQWLDSSPNDDLASLEAEDQTNFDFLQQPTSVFGLAHNKIGYYPRVFDGTTSLHQLVTFSRQLRSIAKEAVASARMEGKTVVELQNLESTFVCKSCPMEIYEPTDWHGLIQHMLDEKNFYESSRAAVVSSNVSSPKPPDEIWVNTHRYVSVENLDPNEAKRRSTVAKLAEEGAKFYGCKLCPSKVQGSAYPQSNLRPRSQTEPVIKAHLRERHSVAAGSETPHVRDYSATDVPYFLDDAEFWDSDGDEFGIDFGYYDIEDDYEPYGFPFF